MYGSRLEAREHAEKAWRIFSDSRSLHTTLDWTTQTDTPDGSPMVSARITGRGAAQALDVFTAEYPLVLGAPGDQRPQADYSNPDRTACFWRKSGVWVELWVPTTVPAPRPSPRTRRGADPALVSASTGRPLFGPGSRLTFTRRGKETTV